MALLFSVACSEESGDTAPTTTGAAGSGGAGAAGGTGGVGGSGGAGGGQPTITDCSAVTCFFVRSDATGAGDGSDWTDAFLELPDDLLRGAVYLVADGTYPGYTFDDEVDGDQLISVKKATLTDHGTEDGWDTGFGDGVADHGPIAFHRSFYLFDGQVGGGRGAYRSGHGFRIHLTDGGMGITVGAPYASEQERLMDRSDITVQHVEVSGPAPPEPCRDTGGGGVAIAGGTDGHRNLTFSNLWLHDLAIGLHGSFAQQIVLEDSCIERNASSSSCHSEGWAAWGPSEQVIVRNNLWSDIEGTAVIALGIADYWDVYHNVFTCAPGHPHGCGVGNGIIGTTDHADQQANHWRVHHNVFVNLETSTLDLISSAAGIAEGNTAYNNIWLSNADGPSFGGVEHDYNWFYDNAGGADDEALAAGEAHGQLGAADPFVDWQGDDFHLTAPTEAGQSLAAPFDTDPDGAARGADGTWDRGLYEYP
jgi:hypothetical protein